MELVHATAAIVFHSAMAVVPTFSHSALPINLALMKFYWVYIMANAHNTVLYVGVTNNIERRVMEHKEHRNPGSFTARYNVEKLVWHEAHQSIDAAITREKQLKEWKRAWKERLIREMNPEWKDLAADGRVW